jgi:hypothetical protein
MVTRRTRLQVRRSVVLKLENVGDSRRRTTLRGIIATGMTTHAGLEP